jgi:hypothetical protein
LSAPVSTSIQCDGVRVSGLIAWCFTAFHGVALAQPLAQSQIGAGKNSVSTCH